ERYLQDARRPGLWRGAGCVRLPRLGADHGAVVPDLREDELAGKQGHPPRRLLPGWRGRDARAGAPPRQLDRRGTHRGPRPRLPTLPQREECAPHPAPRRHPLREAHQDRGDPALLHQAERGRDGRLHDARQEEVMSALLALVLALNGAQPAPAPAAEAAPAPEPLKVPTMEERQAVFGEANDLYKTGRK